MRERWRPIPDFEGYYEISDHGRVRSLSRQLRCADGRIYGMKGRIRKTPLNSGYPALYLSKSGTKLHFYVHYLVMSAFVGPRPKGKEVAHADGNKTNPKLSNLRYATPVENDADKIVHGTRPAGEKNGHAILTNEDVFDIRSRVSHGEKQKSVAADFRLATGHVSQIVNRKIWRHL